MLNSMNLFMKLIKLDGEVAEWLKAHAWKACIEKSSGSNPALSAIRLFRFKKFSHFLNYYIMNICIFYTSPKLEI